MTPKEKVLLCKRVFNTDDGKTLLEEFAKDYHVLHGIYSNDPNNMYFKEGQRSVVMDIINYCDVTLEDFRKARTNVEKRYIDPRLNQKETK